jgi:DNA repair protein RecO (recombination protein O)
MVQRSDRALILRRFAFGETSLVLQVLGREQGRVHLIAKGAYRPTSRYYAALDLFDTLNLEWSHQRGRELEPLSGASIQTRRHTLAHSPQRFRAALTMLELAGAGAREGRPEPELFDLLDGALSTLQHPSVPAPATLAAFELRFLEALGLTPALTHCASCGRESQRPAGRPSAGPRGSRATGARTDFSAGAGGRLCSSCSGAARAAGRRVGTLPVDVLEFAARLVAGEGLASLDPDRLPATLAGSDAAGLERVRDFVARFLEYHLEARPNSYRGFLTADNRNAAATAR